MGGYGLYDVTRGLTTAVAAGLAGLAFWGAAQIGAQTASRFWVATAILAAGGFLLAFSQHVGSWTRGLRLRLSPGTCVLGLLPALVAVGWILLAAQPAGGWQRGRIDSWSAALGILGGVHALGLWRGALAFGFGLVLGFCVDALPAATAASAVADEPLSAERAAVRGQSLPGGIPSRRVPTR